MIEREVWDENESNKEPITLKQELVFENISFMYPTRPDVLALDDISLVVRAGKTTAIVGASGCGKFDIKQLHIRNILFNWLGKSTCMSLLMRFYNPSSGIITIDGQPLNEYNLVQLRKHIGVVSQEPVCFSIVCVFFHMLILQ